jgi:hypothetical protein
MRYLVLAATVVALAAVQNYRCAWSLNGIGGGRSGDRGSGTLW